MGILKIKCYLISLALIAGLTACGKDKPESETPAPAVQQRQQPVQRPAASQPAERQGKVVEKMDAASYTYIRLDDGAGNETWAAVPKTDIEVGEEIALKGGAVMSNFESKTLNRTFDSIIFASGISRGSEDKTPRASGSTTGGLSHGVPSKPGALNPAAQKSGGSAGTIAPFAGLKVEKTTAQNGYTVGELFTKAGDLDKQKVTIKGQVVKISPNIMGKNWFHLQDGTGDPKKNTHDLVVTSSGMAEKGAIISFQGIVAVNKDFGFGYKYDVMVEEAVVVE